MRTALTAIFIIVCLSLPAQAQHGRMHRAKPTAAQIEKKKRAAQIDRDYQAALKKTAEPTGSYDPWKNMRSPSPQTDKR
jgi:hypothetical protein